jgi:hypothetical protein
MSEEKALLLDIRNLLELLVSAHVMRGASELQAAAFSGPKADSDGRITPAQLMSREEALSKMTRILEEERRDIMDLLS